MQRPLLLNLGSGPHVAHGWVSIDASWNAWLAQRPVMRRLAGIFLTEHHQEIAWPQAGILWRDVRKGLPYPDASVDGIYTAHFLEHLTVREAADLLKECHRVLVPGGAARVIVPDLAALIRDYQTATDRPGAAGRFLDSLNLARLRNWPRGWRWKLASLFSRAGHQAVHDRYSMEALMTEAGFDDIGPRSPGESRIPTIEQVETPDRHEASVCLEGVKSIGAPPQTPQKGQWPS